jgi:hypothetical protein
MLFGAGIFAKFYNLAVHPSQSSLCERAKQAVVVQSDPMRMITEVDISRSKGPN